MSSKPPHLGPVTAAGIGKPDPNPSNYSIKGVVRIPPRLSKSKQGSQTPPGSLFIFKNPLANKEEIPVEDEPKSEDRLVPAPQVVDQGNITVTLVTSSKSIATDKDDHKSPIKETKKSDISSSKSKKSTKHSKLTPLNILRSLTAPKSAEPRGHYYDTVKDAILNDQSMRNRIFEARMNELNKAAQIPSSLSQGKSSKYSVSKKASVTSKSSTRSKTKSRKAPHTAPDQQDRSDSKSKKRASTVSKKGASNKKNVIKGKKSKALQDSIPSTTNDDNGPGNKEINELFPMKRSSKPFDWTDSILGPLVPKQDSNGSTNRREDNPTSGESLADPSKFSPLVKTTSSLVKISRNRSPSSIASSKNSRKASSTSSSRTKSRKSKVKKDNRNKTSRSHSPTSSTNSKSSSRRTRERKKKIQILKKQLDRDDNNFKKDKKFPPLQELLANCESYMNWSHRIFSNESLKRYISDIELAYLEPPPSGEYIKNEVLRYDSFECVANLGALCFFQIEFNQLQAAKETIDKTKEFVDESMKKGFFQKDQIYSLDYVWDFLRLYASKREWDLRSQFKHFPEMNLQGFTQNLDTLKPNVKAGIYGLKAYYLSLIGACFDKQVETLRKAINLDHECYEWHCCLQRVLRHRRKSHAKPSSQPKLNYSIEDELQESSIALKIAPNHPRCVLGSMQVLADMATLEDSAFKWNVITFGANKFYKMASVVKYLKDEAKKVIRHLPQSLDANLILADLFLTQLPKNYRDTKLGKECLDRCLLHHPESAKANLRIAQYHLNVNHNYSEAEMYFDTAFSLDNRNYTALTGLLHSMMRTMVKRQDVILDVIKKQVKKSHWSQKQLATLRYLRGLTLFGTSRAPEALEEFLQAYKMDEVSIAFHELPAIHRHFGWPGWPASTVLNFGNLRIEAEVFKEELTNSNHDKDAKIVSAIIKAINKADEVDKQQRRARKKQLSYRNSVSSSSTRGSFN
ncbi:unnamed protein product [Allacma fusca]|uniref:Uncharacterized protein n=1 Tax=Allacma fusca TaxID=39272 RepID=A0A8J2JZC9_9HEXA|nr:unnamed protein product [Allacma fusca]